VRNNDVVRTPLLDPRHRPRTLAGWLWAATAILAIVVAAGYVVARL
jgi:hypothetical protein